MWASTGREPAQDHRLREDLETLGADISTVLDALRPATTAQRLAYIVRAISRQAHEQERIMANLDALTAAVADIGADSDSAEAAVLAKLEEVGATISSLRAEIAALTAGSITQEQIDALTALVGEADLKVEAVATAVAPVVAAVE